jgi:hypothetical protein
VVQSIILLKSLCGVGQPKRKEQIFKQAKWCYDCSFWDDFTSGFRTRYADMAGGWEEVVAVGGRIRTGAGTGVKLDKQYEAGGAAEGKMPQKAGPLLIKQTVFG